MVVLSVHVSYWLWPYSIAHQIWEYIVIFYYYVSFHLGHLTHKIFKKQGLNLFLYCSSCYKPTLFHNAMGILLHMRSKPTMLSNVIMLYTNMTLYALSMSHKIHIFLNQYGKTIRTELDHLNVLYETLHAYFVTPKQIVCLVMVKMWS